VLTPADMDRLISEWLARAHPVPQQACAEWSNQGVALLPLGDLFAAVRLPGELVYAALGCEDPDQVAAALREWLHGPVIHDRRNTGATYYALINWGAGVVQQLDQDEDAPCLGKGVYLGVPRIDRREPTGRCHRDTMVICAARGLCDPSSRRADRGWRSALLPDFGRPRFPPPRHKADTHALIRRRVQDPSP